MSLNSPTKRQNTSVLMLVLLSSIFFNASNPLIRLFILSVWAFLPLYHLLATQKYNKLSVTKNEMFLLIYGIFWTNIFIFSTLKNIDSFAINFQKANVESYTPFLFIFQTFIIIHFSKLKINDPSNFLYYFFLTITLIFSLDLFYRYFLEPDCFLNYWCRTDAKKVGFFSTTNVTGMLLGYLIIASTYLNFAKRRLFMIILFLILITTMARAAIISTLVVLFLRYLSIRNPIRTTLILLSFLTPIYIYFLYDPLNLVTDGSLLSKIDFFSSTYNIVMNAEPYDLLFGFGSSFEYIVTLLGVNGWSAHAPILKSFLYYGLFGVLFFILYLFQIFLAEKKMFFPILFFLICGLAGAPIFWPTLFTGYVLLVLANADESKYKSLRKA